MSKKDPLNHLSLKPVAVSKQGRKCPLAAQVERHEDDGAAIYKVSVGLPTGARPAVIDEVRLLDVDLGAKALEVYQEQYYMPGNSRGFRSLRAGNKPPAIKWWGATHGNEWQLLCYPMTAIQLGPNDVLLVGFTTARTWEAYLLLDTRGKTIRLSAWCNLFGREVRPGEQLAMEELVVVRGRTFAQCVDVFARRTAALANARVPRATITGWSDWQYWREQKSEKDLRQSVPVLQKLNRQGIPVRYLIVDGGWCDHASEWLTPCDKYPSGMKRISTMLRQRGMELGIWLAPYLTNVATKVVRQHPEWMIKDAETGKPLVRKTSNVGPCMMLDYTVPEAMQWLRGIVRMFVRDWKIGYLKLDGPSLAHYLGGVFREKNVTPVEVIRRTLELIREECPDNVIVEGEGLFGPSIGLVDTQRVSQDNHPFWYHLEGQACLKANLNNEMLASYFHGLYWHNHRENVIIRDFLSPFHAWEGMGEGRKDCTLNENELQSYLSGATLAGGAMLLTEPMAELARSAKRMELITRFLPHYDEDVARGTHSYATPIDTFAGNGRQPAIYARAIHRPFEDWHVVGIFNMEDLHDDYVVPLKTIVGTGSFHIFDYWTEQYLGRRSGDVTVKDVPAHGCRMLAVRRATGMPQLVGTNMHILQGAVDIDDCRFEGQTLRIVVGHPMQQDRKLFIWRPAGWKVQSVKTDAVDYLVDERRSPIMCIRFNGKKKTHFEIRWKKV